MNLVLSIFGVIREVAVVAIRRRTMRESGWYLVALVFALSASWLLGNFLEPAIGPADFPIENGPHELFQAAVVGVAGLLFYQAALRFDFEIFYVGLVSAFGCALAVLRETPRCGSPYYDGGPCLTSDGKAFIAVTVAVAILGLAALRREPVARRASELNFFWLTPVAACAGLLLAADIFGGIYYMVWEEETLELAGYVVLLMLALAVNLRPNWFDVPRRRTEEESPGTLSA